MFTADINFWAILLAAVANMVIGSLWYSPLLFAKPWMALTGVRMDEALGKRRNTAYAWMFVSALILAYALAKVMAFAPVESIGDAFGLGFLVWVIVAMAKFADYLFSGRPMRLYLIDIGFHFFEILAMSYIIFRF